ncbi:hypothetical protein [Jiulongibacter sp. NS-SX5]|uniref:hypothetical protein n=1 Tax=Jiulongibacter sp. NS-SX5 TaxID=3463854 RepID=UPI00405985F1
MKTLTGIINKTLSALLITTGGAFAQDIEENMSPLRNKRNYKARAEVRQQYGGTPTGTLTTKEVSKNYKRPNTRKKSLVVSLKTDPVARKRNYKRPY